MAENAENIQNQAEETVEVTAENVGALTVFDKYAIFETGGKQYQAIEGKTLAIEKLEGNIGDAVEFKEVLFRKLGDKDIHIGKPKLEGSIKAKIIKHDREKKVTIFKFKRRKKSRVKAGHRQPFTVVRIETI